MPISTKASSNMPDFKQAMKKSIEKYVKETYKNKLSKGSKTAS